MSSKNREFARANLAHFKAQDSVTFVNELPKNCDRQNSEIYFASATDRDRFAVSRSCNSLPMNDCCHIGDVRAVERLREITSGPVQMLNIDLTHFGMRVIEILHAGGIFLLLIGHNRQYVAHAPLCCGFR